jgi:hypothetical protein
MIFQDHGQVPLSVFWVKIAPLGPVKRATGSNFAEANKQCTNKYHNSKLFKFLKNRQRTECLSLKKISASCGTITFNEIFKMEYFVTLSLYRYFFLIVLMFQGRLSDIKNKKERADLKLNIMIIRKDNFKKKTKMPFALLVKKRVWFIFL